MLVSNTVSYSYKQDPSKTIEMINVTLRGIVTLEMERYVH